MIDTRRNLATSAWSPVFGYGSSLSVKMKQRFTASFGHLVARQRLGSRLVNRGILLFEPTDACVQGRLEAVRPNSLGREAVLQALGIPPSSWTHGRVESAAFVSRWSPERTFNERPQLLDVVRVDLDEILNEHAIGPIILADLASPRLARDYQPRHGASRTRLTVL